MKKKQVQQLAEQWDRALQHAEEAELRAGQLSAEDLKSSISFKIRSTLKAGVGEPPYTKSARCYRG